MKRKVYLYVVTAMLMMAPMSMSAQSEIYPEHFDLEEVTLLEVPGTEQNLPKERRREGILGCENGSSYQNYHC